MAREENTVDLSGTNYDPLETNLSQFLGLKVFLVRDWSGAGAFNQAEATLQFARGEEAWKKARDEYLAAKDAMLASLRENIAARDPAIGAALTDKDLYSIQQYGHVTLRPGNTAQEQAVIVFDPISAPPQQIAMIAVSNDKGEKTASFNIVAGGSPPAGTPAQDAAISYAFRARFNNWWTGLENREDYPQVKDLVENFDMDIDDIRRYEALMKVRYALRNQTEFNVGSNLYNREAPRFYNFAGLSESRGMHKKYYDLSYREVFENLRVEDTYGAEGLGFKDKDFLEKLKLANAVMNIVYNNLTPNNTFARLKHSYSVDGKQIKTIMDDLKKRMEDKVAETYEGYSAWSALDDWRILFPVFRAVYEADKSEGAQREYLDTIMQGLQKWFPTLTNAPIPAADRDHEPPRTLPATQASPTPAQPQPAGPKGP